ncbi:MAG: thiamine pyrophosphate-dependent enzyme [Planctomycetota bacterium]|nr:thiamine pyrophosphate-dependent enzyme [Planctomycetota bacterium]
MANPVHKYLRPDKKFPHIWCPGCSNGITSACVIRSIDSLGLDRNEVVLVSGIGCTARMPVYFDFASLHTTHGRAIPFATGVKCSNPKFKVLVITGDGDGSAIGGNHLIHAARRNIDLTVVLYNNHVYGMTGGQYSPTTPKQAYAATAPWGNYEPMFDICKLAIGAGATYVARGLPSNARLLEKFIADGIAHEGFSLIEVMSFCPSVYSFYNKTGSAPKMMKDLQEHTISTAAANKLREKGEEVDKWEVGVLHKSTEKPEFIKEYLSKASFENKPFSLHLGTLDL